MEDVQPVHIPASTKTIAGHFCIHVELPLHGNRCWSEERDRAPHLVRRCVGGLPYCLWSQTWILHFLGRFLTNSVKQEEEDSTCNVLSLLLFF